MLLSAEIVLVGPINPHLTDPHPNARLPVSYQGKSLPATMSADGTGAEPSVSQ